MDLDHFNVIIMNRLVIEISVELTSSCHHHPKFLMKSSSAWADPPSPGIPKIVEDDHLPQSNPFFLGKKSGFSLFPCEG
jgi:hypothetical protein